MRNSNRQHNQGHESHSVPPRRLPPMLLLILISTAAWMAPAGAAEPDFAIHSEHMLVVHADQARQDGVTFKIECLSVGRNGGGCARPY